MINNASTELYCIFGSPVRHSLSPLIHNTAFQELKINACYVAFEPVGIKQAIEAMKALNILGASVTIPFKIDALEYVDEVDELAKKIGSINTLKNKNGWITGYNTDGPGAIVPILKRHTNIKEKTVLILGNGGSARAIAYAAQIHGAGVIIAGRNPDKINRLADELRNNGKCEAVLLKDLDMNLMKDIDIVINTTPLGMAPKTEDIPLNPQLLMQHHTVFDIVYSPMKTELLEKAKDKGCSVIGGIEMLLNQALLQFKIWTGMDAPEEKILKAIKNYIK